MAFDGNGNWISNFSAVADRDANIKILASRFDNIFIADIASSFENCLTKDTQVKPTQNFNANNYRVINVADPVSDKDAVNKETLYGLLSSIWPVDSIYIGTQSTCPLESLITGSTWTLVSSGKALWTGDGTDGNTTLEAGLPNITGTYVGARLNKGVTSVSGALYSTGSSGAAYADGGSSVGIGFDASKSNAIYGASDTVQPPAYVVNVWRRTA